LRAADEYVGNQSRIERFLQPTPTCPISNSIDAISIGCWAALAVAPHSLNEWYDPAGRKWA